MPKLTLAERLERAAARKARAEQEAARLKLMQRKERTRHLIEVGGLAVKAGIDELPPAALYDRFLIIAAEASDKKAVASWERAGSRHFQAEEDTRVVAVAKFPGKIEPELAASGTAISSSGRARLSSVRPKSSSRGKAGRSSNYQNK
jgi:hypothetical protein